MQNPDELGDYFIDGDFSAELENYLHFWKKKKGGMTMNVLVAHSSSGSSSEFWMRR